MVIRTRACDPCRTRRIRCDETSPHCKQCTRAGRTCPGPMEGALIINVTSETTARASGNHPRKKQSPPRSSSSFLLTGSTIEDSAQEFFQPNRRHSSARIHDLTIKPSQLPILTQAFFANFLDYFANPSNGSPTKFWLQQLPSVHNYENPDGLELAIQAASVAFCGRASSEYTYVRGSRSIYGQALGTHASSVARLGEDAAPNAHMLCTTLMLGFYESISGTEPKGYLRHVEGAAKMVEILGPDGCRDDSVNALFFTARTQMLMVSFITGKKSFFADDSYMAVPYGSQEKPVHERLLDLLTLLIEEYNHPNPNTRILSPLELHPEGTSENPIDVDDPKSPTNDNSHRSRSNSPEPDAIALVETSPPPESVTPEPITASNFILSRVDQTINDLWIEFESTYLKNTPIQWSSLSNSYIYPSAFVAYITSYFDLAIIFSSLIHIRLQNPPPSPRTSKSSTPADGGDKQPGPPQSNFFANHIIKQASASILSCTKYIESQNLGCAFVRVIFPLLIVGLYGRDRMQCSGAVGVLERWEGSGVISGLAGLALGKIRMGDVRVAL